MSTAAIDRPTGPALGDWLAVVSRRVDAALTTALGSNAPTAAVLVEAMRYAVTAGGKRIRPLLVHAAAELGEADPDVVDGCAAAVELIHTYSLIHDDLPCMDDDDLRRGRPTTHIVYGEAQGLLAGDALQALAFEVVGAAGSRLAAGAGGAAGTGGESGFAARRGLALVTVLARAAGASGMAGGQSIDLASVGKALAQGEVETMHRLKTGALLAASIELGAIAACACQRGAGGQPVVDAGVLRFADRIGLAFQVVDDVLDVVADSAALGKTAGKDAANDKPTYVSLLGVDGARAYAARLHAEALAALEPYGARASRLVGLADLIVNRAS